jgi:hypothetical protein
MVVGKTTMNKMITSDEGAGDMGRAMSSGAGEPGGMRGRVVRPVEAARAWSRSCSEPGPQRECHSDHARRHSAGPGRNTSDAPTSEASYRSAGLA